MIRHINVQLLLCFLLGFQITLSAAQTINQSTKLKPASDVRVLVDISGSMKKNDPDNLRIPAVQLMSNLLPPDSHAGIWTFGEYVNMLVPIGPVDNQWKKSAVESVKKINSLGMFTNIGGAMEKASFGWMKPDLSIKRSLILLTDGVVDVSKNPSKNAAARRKVLNELLPKYKEAGITIHTIALSGDADEKLLSKMAAETDGWYQKVVNASELQKVFLKIFEQATERDSVPLKDNRFSIDDQIEEFSVLIFKNKDSKPTLLEQPDGENYDAGSDSARITWFESAVYDLITVNMPMVGEWRVHAEMDPDNRVLIVSNLKLKSTTLPNNLLANEKFNFNINLTQEDETITQQDFLKLLSIEVEVRDNDGETASFVLLDDGNDVDKKALDGIYSIELTAPSNAGIAQISAWVESPTFQRMRQQAMNIFESPVSVKEVISEDVNTPHKIIFTPVGDVSKADSLDIQVNAQLPDGQQILKPAELDKGYNRAIELPVVEAGGNYQIQLTISGETPAGRQFLVNPPIIQFNTKSLVTEPVAELEQEAPVEEIQEEVTEEVDMVLWLGIGLGVNIILIILGWVFSIRMKKQNEINADKLSKQLE
ncbi:MAG: VWA domain-containing protein [Gammaproteobacteria bacterium]|nr:VWA domain-containing protein [Gammaproteobacteria bacterium]